MDIEEIEKFACESRQAAHTQTRMLADQTLLMVETVRLLREIRDGMAAPVERGGDVAG